MNRKKLANSENCLLEQLARPREWVNKRYCVGSLLDRDWHVRVQAIEEMTREHQYPTRFKLCKDLLIRSTCKLPKDSKKIRTPNLEQIKAIGRQLEFMHGVGITHGDVHAKNIWWDGNRAVLMDYEPSLLQLIGQRQCLMGTAPRIHTVDRRNSRLSILTDQLGFVMWAFRLDLEQATLIAASGKDWQELSNAAHQKKSIFL